MVKAIFTFKKSVNVTFLLMFKQCSLTLNDPIPDKVKKLTSNEAPQRSVKIKI